MFANDTSMYLCLDNHKVSAEILNSDLEKISTWATKWKVTFNNTKTELMNVWWKKDLRPLPLKFENTLLTDLKQRRHLGVTLQQNCKWDEPIKSIIVKGCSLVACFRSYKYCLCRKLLENMYKSFILPYFDHADVTWDNCMTRLSEELEHLHLDAIRTIT